MLLSGAILTAIDIQLGSKSSMISTTLLLVSGCSEPTSLPTISERLWTNGEKAIFVGPSRTSRPLTTSRWRSHEQLVKLRPSGGVAASSSVRSTASNCVERISSRAHLANQVRDESHPWMSKLLRRTHHVPTTIRDRPGSAVRSGTRRHAWSAGFSRF